MLFRSVPAGSKVRFQVHYASNKEVLTDRTRVGLYFASRPPERPLKRVDMRNRYFLIPAGAANHEVKRCYDLESDKLLLAITPHAHYRGKDALYELVHADGRREVVPDPTAYGSTGEAPGARPSPYPGRPDVLTRRMPLGTFVHARSGDKGGNANVGLFARSAAAYVWLEQFLTAERLQQLLPDTAGLEIRRYALPNIWSLNFVIVGLLEEGVAASSRQDGQAKSLGEYVRAKVVDLPSSLLS